ncbi:MAG: hypothetical protein CMI52_03465 [Parcubacteria group bacterium]|nr:hypothetical protein [Parcubacteria group bacterium]|tara:strand:- start:92 stop:397 length:306 start_codon:yes stop_codon:yes gene_type:complete
MSNEEVQIEVADPIKAISKKLDKFFYTLVAVGLVFVTTLVIMVATLVVDSFHFNSVTYKEYSTKLDATENSNQTIQQLLNQSVSNQIRIEELQKQILEKEN